MELLGQVRNPSEALFMNHRTRERRRSRTQRELCIMKSEIYTKYLYENLIAVHVDRRRRYAPVDRTKSRHRTAAIDTNDHLSISRYSDKKT
jgi:hypothetical protein